MSGFLFLFSGCRQDEVTVRSLVYEISDRESLTYYPEKEFRHVQFSSYNRLSVQPGNENWFANNDMSHFIRVEQNSGRREFVLLDTNGPGAIVRWWMTFYKAQHGMIRIYLDGSDSPVIQGSPDELLSGDMITGGPLAVSVQAGAPLGEEGRDYDHNLYVPVPFSKHCKVTYECDSLRVLYDYEGTKVEEGYYWPDVFYNIGCRIYPASTRVESFSMKALKLAVPLLIKAGYNLTEKNVEPEEIKDYNKNVASGDSMKIEYGRSSYAINYLLVRIRSGDMPQALRSTVLKMKFDDFKTVWTPVGEFFGSGYTLNPHKTWMNRMDEKGKMESFWVMPFRDSCKIVLVNYGSGTVEVDCSVGLENYDWNENSMYFASGWHEYNNIRTRIEKQTPFDLNFINIRGCGLYAGDQVTIFNNTWHWWGEGDEKIFVDGESFPSSFGTGTEDYYGYSFGRKEPFSHPFLSQPEGTGNMSRGLTVNTRLRSLDAIPFRVSLSSNIELWHWADTRMNYALTTFFYVRPPFMTNIIPDIESVARPVAR